MKKQTAVLSLLLALVLGLSGCEKSLQVENQGFVIVMGIDRAQEDQLRMCVQIPKIAGKGEEESASKNEGSDAYIRLEVVAEDYEAALDKLNWASPRRLNLSQLKLVVLSKDLAENAGENGLIRRIAQTERLFTSAHVAVCEGSACDFVSAVKPTIGIRMSSDIQAILEHDQRQGFIPPGYLAELHYQMESVYSDPLAIYAVLAPQAQSAFARDKSPETLSSENLSEIQTRYIGSAIFSEGHMRGILDARQTILTNLLRNSLASFYYWFNGESTEIVPASAPRFYVNTDAEPVEISVDLNLCTSSEDFTPDMEPLRQALEDELLALFETVQRMNAEPFGFAEVAARHFATMDAWIAYNWHERFQSAVFTVNINLQQSDA